MNRADGGLTGTATLLTTNPFLPLFPRCLASGVITFNGITVTGINNLFVLLHHRGLRPLAAIGKIHHPFRHVLAIELRFVECHIRLQYTVGQHVIQPRISPLYHHCRQTRHGSARPLNHIPHQVFKTVSDPVELVSYCGFQIEVPAHQIAAPAQVQPELLHITARRRLGNNGATAQGVKQLVRHRTIHRFSVTKRAVIQFWQRENTVCHDRRTTGQHHHHHQSLYLHRHHPSP